MAKYVCQYCDNKFEPSKFEAKIKCPKCRDRRCKKVDTSYTKVDYYGDKKTEEDLQRAFDELIDWNSD